MIIDHLPSEQHNLLSFDEVELDTHDLYQHEFLHFIVLRDLSSHILKVKKVVPLMLLRNIDPKYRSYNEKILLYRGFYMNMLNIEILTGQHVRQRL